MEVAQLRAEIDGLKKEKDELNSKHSREMTRLERCLSSERLDMEQKYKLEIADSEDTYVREKELIIKSFTKQKVLLLNVTLVTLQVRSNIYLRLPAQNTLV